MPASVGVPLTWGARRLNSIMSLAATQQVCAAGALLAILQRDHVLSMAAPAARGGDEVELDDRHPKALLLESLAEVALAPRPRTLYLLCDWESDDTLTALPMQVSLSGFLNVDAVSQNALSIFQVPAQSSSCGTCNVCGCRQALRLP